MCVRSSDVTLTRPLDPETQSSEGPRHSYIVCTVHGKKNPAVPIVILRNIPETPQVRVLEVMQEWYYEQ